MFAIACKLGRHSGEWSLPNEQCSTVMTCRSCGKIQAKEGHIWGQFGYLADAQCDQRHRCERCGATEPRVHHKWGPWMYLSERAQDFRQFRTCGRCQKDERTKYGWRP